MTTCPELASYQRRLSSSVTTPSWTMRLSERSSGSASPRFSRHSRSRAPSSSPIMMRASEPPMKLRRCVESVILSVCAFTDLSHLDGLVVPALVARHQQKLLIRDA